MTKTFTKIFFLIDCAHKVTTLLVKEKIKFYVFLNIQKKISLLIIFEDKISI